CPIGVYAEVTHKKIPFRLRGQFCFEFLDRSIRKVSIHSATKESYMIDRLRLRLRPVLSCLFAFLLVVSSAFGQSARGTITGVVKDATGAVVPHAEVVIVNKATGEGTRT